MKRVAEGGGPPKITVSNIAHVRLSVSADAIFEKEPEVSEQLRPK
ncbi:hypothetical protein [Pelagibacterium sp. H642]|nr:hypothetical protein [Pelagibacterium sp. H642]WMT92895.1 hypothetical protein NO934_19145 [Pelagibacterium sp. H642]